MMLLQAQCEPIQLKPIVKPSAGLSRPASTNVETLIRKYFPRDQWENALKVAKCESDLNSSNINDNPRTKDYSVGVFQINLFGRLRESRPSEEYLLDAENNIKYAFEMWQGSGYNPWTCARKVL